MKRMIAVLVLLVLILGLSGCKEDGASSGDVPSKSTTGAQVPVKTKADMEKSDAFREMVAKKSNLQFKAEYTVNMDANGQKTTYKTAQYLGGPKRMRVDTNMMGGNVRAYFLEDGYYSCNDRQGWQCMKFGNEEEMQQQDYTKDFKAVEENPDDYDVSYAGTMDVAGTTAYCYGIKYAGQTLKDCFSKEGVPLYMEMEGPGMNYLMKATSYSTSVSDSDFKLPAKAQDMSQMMEQYQEQMQQYQMPE